MAHVPYKYSGIAILTPERNAVAELEVNGP